MTITRTDENGKITLKPEGWLDTAGAPQLGQAVEAIDAATEIVLDLDAVEYMASAGLRQIVAANRKAKELQAEFSVIHAGTEVMSIFRMSGIDKKIKVFAGENS